MPAKKTARVKYESFDQWKAAADRLAVATLGLRLDDLPDVNYDDWYEDGLSPARAVKKARRYAEE